jgi:hypothetical protein
MEGVEFDPALDRLARGGTNGGSFDAVVHGGVDQMHERVTIDGQAHGALSGGLVGEFHLRFSR